jgi:hypothetical protein
MKLVAGDRSLGSASRLNASAKLRAVTAAPVWKRNVRFRSKVYTRPSFETAWRSTTSGITRVPAAPGSSGWLKSFAQVAKVTGADQAVYASAGST